MSNILECKNATDGKLKDLPVVNMNYCPSDGIGGQIRCVGSDASGFMFKRVHSYYEGETWRFRPDQWQQAGWIPVSGQFQML